LFLVPDSEQWGLQDKYMSAADQFRKKLEKKGNQEQTDVHPVDIGIGSDYDLGIPQVIDAFLNIEGCLKQVELFVLIHHFLGQAKGIQRFASEAENRLRINVPRFCDRTAGRIAFGNKNTALFPFFIIVGEMNPSITQFPVVKVRFLCPFLCQIFYACDGFSLPF